MTFKGVEYQTILDIERTLFVAEADEKVLNFQLQNARLQCNKKDIEETMVKLNVQQNFIKQLKELIADLVEKIDRINETTNDIESKIFIDLFVKNKTHNEIMSELYICRAVYYRYINSLSKKLENKEGEELKTALTE